MLFGVKNIYKFEITGKANTTLIDENFRENCIAYEESILLIQASSFDEAYDIAENIAREKAFSYVNIYDQQVNFLFIDSIDCFKVDEEVSFVELLPFQSIEIYSNIIEVDTPEDEELFLKNKFPVQEGKKHMIINKDLPHQ